MSEPDSPPNTHSATRKSIGIDLGTTYSVTAHINDAGRPETIPNAEGDLLTPSVVLFDGTEVIVGKEAAKAKATEMDHVADCPKRQIGQQLYSKRFGGRQYPPEALQGWILNKLRRDAERVIGPFGDAVVTVPAYFDESRRKATQDSGFIGGLNVLDIINEPTAAAIAYGYHAGWMNLNGNGNQDSINVLVYDLGGGTFDVTLMEVKQGHFRTIATDGDMQLGGEDWDQRLVDHVAGQFQAETGIDPRTDSIAIGKLKRDCRDAKETLSSRSRTHVDCVCGNTSLKLEIKRDDLERMTLDLLDRTEFTIRQTLRAGGMTWPDIDKVILVGGSTRMPSVREMLTSLANSPPDVSLSPDEAVAHGAALRAAMLSSSDASTFLPSRIQNVNSHSLGVVANEVATGMPQVVTLIPRNTPLPVVARRIFKTHKKDQESFLIQITEGESSSPSECSQLGKCSIWDLPEKLPVGTLVEIKFAYQENGRLRVKVKIGGEDRRAFRYEIQRPSSLTQEQIDRWREYICSPPA